MARTLTNQWPEDRIERLKVLWADPAKLKPRAIAEELGLTRNAVIGMAYRLGLSNRVRDYETEAWSPADVALLKELWNAPERYSQKTIGVRLGKTRSSVSSKAKQLGLKDREPAKTRFSTKVTSDGKIIQFPMQRKPSEGGGRKSNAQLFAERYPTTEASVAALQIGFEELSDTVCKFECSGQDDVSLFRFCGRPSVPDRPYCVGHCRIAYQPAPPPGQRNKPRLDLGGHRGGVFGRVA